MLKIDLQQLFLSVFLNGYSCFLLFFSSFQKIQFTIWTFQRQFCIYWIINNNSACRRRPWWATILSTTESEKEFKTFASDNELKARYQNILSQVKNVKVLVLVNFFILVKNFHLPNASVLTNGPYFVWTCFLQSKFLFFSINQNLLLLIRNNKCPLWFCQIFLLPDF